MQTFWRITEVKWGIICIPPNNQSCEPVQPSVICVWMWQHPSCHPHFTRSHAISEYLNTTHKALRPTKHSKHLSPDSYDVSNDTWRILVFTTVKMPGNTNISRKSSLLMLMFVRNEASNALNNEPVTYRSVFKLVKSAKRLQNKHMTLNSAFYYQIIVSYNKINQCQVRI